MAAAVPEELLSLSVELLSEESFDGAKSGSDVHPVKKARVITAHPARREGRERLALLLVDEVFDEFTSNRILVLNGR